MSPSWAPEMERVEIPDTRKGLVDWLNQWVNAREVMTLREKNPIAEEMREFMKRHGVE